MSNEEKDIREEELEQEAEAGKAEPCECGEEVCECDAGESTCEACEEKAGGCETEGTCEEPEGDACADEEAAPNEDSEASKETSEEDEAIRDKYLRLMADFQNYKKRVEKERSDIHAFANEKIVTDLLQVMDNFERALATDETEGFKEGMGMIFDQMKDVLAHAGVAEIEAYDVVFDPNVHNAVMMEDTDAVESGNVSDVLQKGYTRNGKVIRPSMVKVAK